MTSERYEKIGQLFHAALELPAESRVAFLSGACGVDVDLRQEVESLLDAHDKAGDFATAPPASVFAAWLASEGQPAGLSGRIGAYEVLSPIGRGGMGEVYLAHDTRLGRKVAVKVLQAPLTSNPDAARRFEQEARAASSLNHPNIVTIYEIGDLRDRRFIAMEFVEGRSLAAMIGRPVDAATLAKLGAQLARALSVAHAAGIVHRDIKPENVIVRDDGYVKVLDFGLARLARLPTVEDADAITNPNLLLGTPRYMSPEQARGETATAASDVFSLARRAVRAGDGQASVGSGLHARHASRHHVGGRDNSAAVGARSAAGARAAAHADARQIRGVPSLGGGGRGGAVGDVGRDDKHANAGIAARSRAPNAQPAASTYRAGRPSRRGRQRQGSAPEFRRPAAHIDRTGRHRQDTPRHPGGRGAGRRVRRRRVRQPGADR